jgi:hypothetical protein
MYVRGGSFWAAGVILAEDGTYNLADGNEWTTEDELIVCGNCKTKFLLERAENGTESLVPLDGHFDLEGPGGPKGRIVSDDKLTTIEVDGLDGAAKMQLSTPALRRLVSRLLAYI